MPTKTFTLRNTDRKELHDDLKKGKELDGQQFAPFIGKKVKIFIRNANNPNATKEGKIIKVKETYFFIPKGRKTRGYYLTAGLFDNFSAHLTVDKVELL